MSDETPDQTLARWHAEAETIRARKRALEPAPLGREQLAGTSGLEQIRSLLEGGAPPPIGVTLDFMLVHAEFGRAVFQGKPGRTQYNPMGAVHGGWFATLLDSALGCAVHTAMPIGKAYTTLELKINIVRALSDKVPLVRADGRTIHVGGQTATAEAKLVGHDGKLYAHGTTTCLVFNMPSTK